MPCSSNSNNSESTSSLSEITSGQSSPREDYLEPKASSSSKDISLVQQSPEKKSNLTETLGSGATTVMHPEQPLVNNKQIPNSNLIDSTTGRKKEHSLR